MALICCNCGTINQDPGGDPRLYRCGVCGQPCLQRIPEQPRAETGRLIAAIAGATILGLAIGNPIGALVGALGGYALGQHLVSK